MISRFVRPSVVAACCGFLALTSAAHAADGKPFLMKVGTGGVFAFPPPGGAWTDALSVSITPKKTGICTVTASYAAETQDGPFSVSLSTASATGGPWIQGHTEQNAYVSSAMTQAFIVQKDVPVTFYLVAGNQGTVNATIEATRIWVICAQEKTPVLP